MTKIRKCLFTKAKRFRTDHMHRCDNRVIAARTSAASAR